MGVGSRPTAVVTGGATGVGAAVALWLAEREHDVLINFRASEREATETAACCSAFGADVICVQGDVADDTDCRRIAEVAAERWGRIDILINSAGATLFRPMHDLDALDADDFRHIYSVNVIGPYQMTRAVVPVMRLTGGAIVNISSIAGTNGSGSSYAYAASKGALNTLTLSLARTLAPQIRVNALLPGMVDSRWLRDGIGDAAFARSSAIYAEQAVLHIIPTPAQIAEVAGWLATAANVMTGQLVTVDAGAMLGQQQVLLK